MFSTYQDTRLRFVFLLMHSFALHAKEQPAQRHADDTRREVNTSAEDTVPSRDKDNKSTLFGNTTSSRALQAGLVTAVGTALVLARNHGNTPVILTDDTFQAEVLDNDQPTLVDFWASWCGPCRRMTPIIEDLAKTYAGRVTIAKLNTQDYPKTSRQYKIRSIPTFVLFVQGQEVKRISGGCSKKVLMAMIDAYLPPKS